MSRVRVFVFGEDGISQAGVATQLRSRPDILIVDNGDIDSAEVAVVIVDAVDESCGLTVRAVQRNGCPRVVLVVSDLDDAGLMGAVEVGACGVLRRQEATPERLESAVMAAVHGDGTLAPDLLGRLMVQMSRLQRDVLAPRGIGPSGVSDRELDVLRLLADGFDTAEIARRLAYSERTIKNIIHDLTSRLNLKNRLHAVAYAMKAGLI
ncbi:MAG TPA: response regulator transcription factor [Acidimicrobiales bacterium]|nr:response regulator transcription factor [Acidimicrobiales bacterium]